MFSWAKLQHKVHRRILKDKDAHDVVDMKRKTFEWTEKREATFQELKEEVDDVT